MIKKTETKLGRALRNKLPNLDRQPTKRGKVCELVGNDTESA